MKNIRWVQFLDTVLKRPMRYRNENYPCIIHGARSPIERILNFTECCQIWIGHALHPPTINIPQTPDKHILKTKTKDNIRLNHSDTRTNRISTKKQTHLSVDRCTYRRQSSLVRPFHRLQNVPAAPLASWNNRLDQHKWNDCVHR